MKHRDSASVKGTRRSFPATDWIVIDRIAMHKDDDRVLTGQLLKGYWEPVYYYLRRRGCSHEEARDITQGFFCEVVLDHHLVERADRSKGQFRSLLCHALNQYLVNERAKQAAQSRIPASRLIPLGEFTSDILPACPLGSQSSDVPDYARISALLKQILAEVKAACYADGLTTHWQVFNARIVQPIRDNCKPPALEQVCKELGIADVGKASNMIITVKRRFRAVLRRHLRCAITSAEHVDAEIDDLIKFLPELALERSQ